ncbi:hypothetical protein BESB_040280 [Besnoitia besnoiti]|uniref:Uncharacterized protein n=1 Tax=Besnoitia besnoiti TaxID=94643 RepID=A0A2A9MP61_BESBE|nr:hypothetical protein BESB_040280 [Besnoitia besnoiti]PFH37570.1 hypothetical protein BESB_040280 [Besnoitia besnoiti]
MAKSRPSKNRKATPATPAARRAQQAPAPFEKKKNTVGAPKTRPGSFTDTRVLAKSNFLLARQWRQKAESDRRDASAKKKALGTVDPHAFVNEIEEALQKIRHPTPRIRVTGLVHLSASLSRLLAALSDQKEQSPFFASSSSASSVALLLNPLLPGLLPALLGSGISERDPAARTAVRSAWTSLLSLLSPREARKGASRRAASAATAVGGERGPGEAGGTEEERQEENQQILLAHRKSIAVFLQNGLTALEPEARLDSLHLIDAARRLCPALLLGEEELPFSVISVLTCGSASVSAFTSLALPLLLQLLPPHLPSVSAASSTPSAFSAAARASLSGREESSEDVPGAARRAQVLAGLSAQQRSRVQQLRELFSKTCRIWLQLLEDLKAKCRAASSASSAVAASGGARGSSEGGAPSRRAQRRDSDEVASLLFQMFSCLRLLHLLLLGAPQLPPDVRVSLLLEPATEGARGGGERQRDAGAEALGDGKVRRALATAPRAAPCEAPPSAGEGCRSCLLLVLLLLQVSESEGQRLKDNEEGGKTGQASHGKTQEDLFFFFVKHVLSSLAFLLSFTLPTESAAGAPASSSRGALLHAVRLSLASLTFHLASFPLAPLLEDEGWSLSPSAASCAPSWRGLAPPSPFARRGAYSSIRYEGEELLTRPAVGVLGDVRRLVLSSVKAGVGGGASAESATDGKAAERATQISFCLPPPLVSLFLGCYLTASLFLLHAARQIKRSVHDVQAEELRDCHRASSAHRKLAKENIFFYVRGTEADRRVPALLPPDSDSGASCAAAAAAAAASGLGAASCCNGLSAGRVEKTSASLGLNANALNAFSTASEYAFSPLSRRTVFFTDLLLRAFVSFFSPLAVDPSMHLRDFSQRLVDAETRGGTALAALSPLLSLSLSSPTLFSVVLSSLFPASPSVQRQSLGGRQGAYALFAAFGGLKKTKVFFSPSVLQTFLREMQRSAFVDELLREEGAAEVKDGDNAHAREAETREGGEKKESANGERTTSCLVRGILEACETLHHSVAKASQGRSEGPPASSSWSQKGKSEGRNRFGQLASLSEKKEKKKREKGGEERESEALEASPAPSEPNDAASACILAIQAILLETVSLLISLPFVFPDLAAERRRLRATEAEDERGDSEGEEDDEDEEEDEEEDGEEDKEEVEEEGGDGEEEENEEGDMALASLEGESSEPEETTKADPKLSSGEGSEGGSGDGGCEEADGAQTEGAVSTSASAADEKGDSSQPSQALHVDGVTQLSVTLLPLSFLLLGAAPTALCATMPPLLSSLYRPLFPAMLVASPVVFAPSRRDTPPSGEPSPLRKGFAEQPRKPDAGAANPYYCLEWSPRIGQVYVKLCAAVAALASPREDAERAAQAPEGQAPEDLAPEGRPSPRPAEKENEVALVVAQMANWVAGVMRHFALRSGDRCDFSLLFRAFEPSLLALFFSAPGGFSRGRSGRSGLSLARDGAARPDAEGSQVARPSCTSSASLFFRLPAACRQFPLSLLSFLGGRSVGALLPHLLRSLVLPSSLSSSCCPPSPPNSARSLVTLSPMPAKGELDARRELLEMLLRGSTLSSDAGAAPPEADVRRHLLQAAQRNEKILLSLLCSATKPFALSAGAGTGRRGKREDTDRRTRRREEAAECGEDAAEARLQKKRREVKREAEKKDGDRTEGRPVAGDGAGREGGAGTTSHEGEETPGAALFSPPSSQLQPCLSLPSHLFALLRTAAGVHTELQERMLLACPALFAAKSAGSPRASIGDGRAEPAGSGEAFAKADALSECAGACVRCAILGSSVCSIAEKVLHFSTTPLPLSEAPTGDWRLTASSSAYAHVFGRLHAVVGTLFCLRDALARTGPAFQLFQRGEGDATASATRLAPSSSAPVTLQGHYAYSWTQRYRRLAAVAVAERPREGEDEREARAAAENETATLTQWLHADPLLPAPFSAGLHLLFLFLQNPLFVALATPGSSASSSDTLPPRSLSPTASGDSKAWELDERSPVVAAAAGDVRRLLFESKGAATRLSLSLISRSAEQEETSEASDPGQERGDEESDAFSLEAALHALGTEGAEEAQRERGCQSPSAADAGEHAVTRHILELLLDIVCTTASLCPCLSSRARENDRPGAGADAGKDGAVRFFAHFFRFSVFLLRSVDLLLRAALRGALQPEPVAGEAEECEQAPARRADAKDDETQEALEKVQACALPRIDAFLLEEKRKAGSQKATRETCGAGREGQGPVSAGPVAHARGDNEDASRPRRERVEVLLACLGIVLKLHRRARMSLAETHFRARRGDRMHWLRLYRQLKAEERWREREAKLPLWRRIVARGEAEESERGGDATPGGAGALAGLSSFSEPFALKNGARGGQQRRQGSCEFDADEETRDEAPDEILDAMERKEREHEEREWEVILCRDEQGFQVVARICNDLLHDTLPAAAKELNLESDTGLSLRCIERQLATLSRSRTAAA